MLENVAPTVRAWLHLTPQFVAQAQKDMPWKVVLAQLVVRDCQDPFVVLMGASCYTGYCMWMVGKIQALSLVIVQRAADLFLVLNRKRRVGGWLKAGQKMEALPDVEQNGGVEDGVHTASVEGVEESDDKLEEEKKTQSVPIVIEDVVEDVVVDDRQVEEPRPSSSVEQQAILGESDETEECIGDDRSDSTCSTAPIPTEPEEHNQTEEPVLTVKSVEEAVMNNEFVVQKEKPAGLVKKFAKKLTLRKRRTPEKCFNPMKIFIPRTGVASKTNYYCKPDESAPAS